jgi:hypothetical protein
LFSDQSTLNTLKALSLWWHRQTANKGILVEGRGERGGVEAGELCAREGIQKGRRDSKEERPIISRWKRQTLS